MNMPEMPFLYRRQRPAKSLLSRPLRSLATVALTLSLKTAQAGVVSISDAATGLSLRVDEARGSYEVTWKNPAWAFEGNLGVPLKDAVASSGSDVVGAYQQIAFTWQTGQTPMTGQIRIYERKPVALFSATCQQAVELPPAAFPAFSRLPAGLHTYSHSLSEFGPPQFKANEISTPWLMFDDQANAMIISPASNFMVASMFGDGRQKVASGFNPNLRRLPAGFTQHTLVAFGQGINRTWDLWGDALLAMNGSKGKRPANDADVILKYLGYWTDNGASYYYHYDADKGYAGTLQALVKLYREENIPIHYLQLDSWWYSKSTTGADGKSGKSRKVESLPEGEWNRYGGTLEYKAHPALFPDGLDAFQKSIGIPLVTHSRWIDPESPYHQKYNLSGLAAVDPRWWDDIAKYLKTSGVAVYEQDWLDRIYRYSPAFSGDAGTAAAFLDQMARACRENGITLQYCMPYACHFMQGSRYENLTTIRTVTDRFNPKRWNDFLYTSRLASSLGIWPWADVYFSTEEPNVLLSTLSAGPVGIGDVMGAETMTNLSKAVRADGVIVKPDVPIVPTDRTYIADAQKATAPLVASTRTRHGETQTEYVFAFNRPQDPASEVKFAPSDFGFRAPVYVYDYFAGVGRRLEANAEFSARLKRGTNAFYVIAPVGASGIALLGDHGKYVGTGKQRLTALKDQPDKLSLEVLIADTEQTVTLHGYAPATPHVTVGGGRAAAVNYARETGYFTVEVRPLAGANAELLNGDRVRRVAVGLDLAGK